MKYHVLGAIALLATTGPGTAWAGDGTSADEGGVETNGPTAMNTVYAEGLGPGGLYSLNYERRIADFGARVGFSYLSAGSLSMTTIPIGFNYIGIGGTRNHLELGAVATVVIVDGDGIFGDTHRCRSKRHCGLSVSARRWRFQLSSRCFPSRAHLKNQETDKLLKLGRFS